MNADEWPPAYRLVRTCSACPEQYDVYCGTEKVGYLRLRHGNFTAEYPDCDGKMVYQAYTKGDGIFTADERPVHMQLAIEAIVLAHSATEEYRSSHE